MMIQAYSQTIQQLQELRKRVHPLHKERVDHIIVLVEEMKIEAEIAVEYATQMRLRNADFDGDWIGHPDDDFKE